MILIIIIHVEIFVSIGMFYRPEEIYIFFKLTLFDLKAHLF